MLSLSRKGGDNSGMEGVVKGTILSGTEGVGACQMMAYKVVDKKLTGKVWLSLPE